MRRFRPELTTPPGRRTILPGVVAHRSDTLDRLDGTVVDRIPTTTVARTLLDLGAVVPAADVERAAQAAILERKVGEIDLVCLLERLGGRGKRGTTALRAAVLSGLPPEELQSRLEWELLRVVRSCPVDPAILQHEVELPDGRRAVLDLAWPERMVAAEADGRRWHSTRAQFEADLRRSNALQALGWAHYRYGWNDLRHRRDGIRLELLDILRRRSAA